MKPVGDLQKRTELGCDLSLQVIFFFIRRVKPFISSHLSSYYFSILQSSKLLIFHTHVLELIQAMSRASDNNQAPPVSAAEILAKRAKLRSSQGNFPPSNVPPDSSNETLQELLGRLREDHSSNVELHAYECSSVLKQIHLEEIKREYTFPRWIKVRLPGLADRSCNWHPEKLCVLLKIKTQ